jgi:hypothetical protein
MPDIFLLAQAVEHDPHDNGRRFAALKFDILINNSIGLQED